MQHASQYETGDRCCRPRSATVGLFRSAALAAAAFLIAAHASGLLSPGHAAPRPESYWDVDEIRAGMKGHGLTVMKGTKIERFEAEVLGVLKNTSPGRDMVLCRLSGLDLEKTGVIAGMSGSPIYIDGKLLGAVAYAWPFGKEPIAGITPFSQMHHYVEAYEQRDLVEEQAARRVGLAKPLAIGGTIYDAVQVSGPAGASAPGGGRPIDSHALRMTPLKLPLAGTGFTSHSLNLLGDRLADTGIVPVQGGGAAAQAIEDARDAPLLPGSPLVIGMVVGDFDLSGVGTVTHVEGCRVYGWGHPLMSLGTCEFPLMTGFIHTIYPRQSLSFKMGSPIQEVGIINADVSTGVAGWLGKTADMLPVRMTVTRDPGGASKTFNVRVARQRSMVAHLVSTVLTNSVDMEGELPEELTAEMRAVIEVEGKPPIVIHDTFSGSSYSGGRAPQALYNQISAVVQLLSYNPHKPVRINRIECETRITPGRRTAEIDAVELDSDMYSPGETLRGNVYLRPYKGPRERTPIELKIPADLPEGRYTMTVCDDLYAARQELRDNPLLSSPQDLAQVFEALRVQTAVKRTNLVLRVPVNAVGVALDGKALPNLPPSMVEILGTSRRTGVQTMGGALVERQPTNWVVQGSESVSFTVTKNKKVLSEP